MKFPLQVLESSPPNTILWTSMSPWESAEGNGIPSSADCSLRAEGGWITFWEWKTALESRPLESWILNHLDLLHHPLLQAPDANRQICQLLGWHQLVVIEQNCVTQLQFLHTHVGVDGRREYHTKCSHKNDCPRQDGGGVAPLINFSPPPNQPMASKTHPSHLSSVLSK